MDSKRSVRTSKNGNRNQQKKNTTKNNNKHDDNNDDIEYYKFDILNEFLYIIANYLEGKSDISCLEFCSGIYLNLLGCIEDNLLNANTFSNKDDMFYNVVEEIKYLIDEYVSKEENYDNEFKILYIIILYHEWVQAIKMNNAEERNQYFILLYKSWEDWVS